MRLQFITPFSVRIGVLGAGTMGSGIALTILLADMPVTLYDVSTEMLEKATSYIESHLERKGKSDNIAYLNLTSHLDDLSSAMVLIEAAPEDLALKQELFAALDGICPPPPFLPPTPAHFRSPPSPPRRASLSAWLACTSSTPPR